MREPCRFGIRCDANGESVACFEVFDRMTGKTVASQLSRTDAEAEIRRRNHDTSGKPGELLAFCTAVDAFMAQAGRHSLTVVARAAEVLDDLREELAKTDRAIAEQQGRIGQLRKLFPEPDTDSE